MEKIFAILTIARQIDGDFLFIKAEKAFTKASEADKHRDELKKTYIDKEGKLKPLKMSSIYGDIDCFCEVGSFELELNNE